MRGRAWSQRVAFVLCCCPPSEPGRTASGDQRRSSKSVQILCLSRESAGSHFSTLLQGRRDHCSNSWMSLGCNQSLTDCSWRELSSSTPLAGYPCPCTRNDLWLGGDVCDGLCLSIVPPIQEHQALGSRTGKR